MRNALLIVPLLVVAGSAQAEEQVKLPLDAWKKTHEELRRLAQAAELGAKVRAVAIGETIYRGRSDGRNLHLTLTLRAHLGASPEHKIVDVVGLDAVVVSAKLKNGTAIALAPSGGHWAWLTAERGPVELIVELVVPPRGPRGSIEYRFGVVESPVTELAGFFPTEGLSPIVSGAVTNQVRSRDGGTELFAVLSPTQQIHIVGFHDVAAGGDERAAKLYGRTESLVSISDDGVELFSAISYTILYATEKRFRIELPAGYDLVSAEGVGAFQYTLEPSGGAQILVGETAYAMPSRYEISLRLRRPLATTEKTVALPLPRLLDVERDVGFLGIEIPGKLTVERVDAPDLRSIDARELPPAIIKSSVSPVVRAFRYSGDKRGGAIELARHPEKALAAGGVDVLRATSVATGDGRLMTDLLFTIRNNLQQYLVLELGQDATVVSAVLDGDPIKPSRNANGRVLVPLKRSKTGPSGLVPFRVQLVYEQRISELGAIGRRALELPKLEVPIASLDWSVYVPPAYAASTLAGAISAQQFVKNARWHRGNDGGELEEDRDETRDGFPSYEEDEALAQAEEDGEGEGEQADEPSDEAREPENAREPARLPPADSGDAASGAMPVRVQIPRDGNKLTHQRFWIDAGEPIHVTVWYARTPLPLAAKMLAAIALAIVALTFARRTLRTWPARIESVARRRWSNALLATRERWITFNAELAERRKEHPWSAFVAPVATLAWTSAKLAALCVLGAILAAEIISLIALLQNPL